MMICLCCDVKSDLAVNFCDVHNFTGYRDVDNYVQVYDYNAVSICNVCKFVERTHEPS